MLLRLFHLSVASLYWYTVWYDLSFINIPFPDNRLGLYPMKGRVTFLTFWCLNISNNPGCIYYKTFARLKGNSVLKWTYEYLQGKGLPVDARRDQEYCLLFLILDPKPPLLKYWLKLFAKRPFTESTIGSIGTIIIWWLPHMPRIMQTTYFTISVLNDYIGTNVSNPKQSSIIRTIKDTLFILAFPTAFYVAVAFWGIYTVDKDLIFPDHVAKEFPPWANHTMHTFVLLFIFLELVLCYRRYPSRALGYTIVGCFNMTYAFWFHCIWYKTGAWVYPIFNVLNWPARVGFVIASTTVALVFYVLGEKLNGLVWSKVNKQKVKSK